PEGKRRFDAIRTAMAALEGRIGDLRTRARHRLDSDTTRLQSVIGGGLLLVVLVGILLWVALRRWVTGPLIRLGEGADRVAEGELDHVIDPAGPAELQQLALRIEQMRSRIVRDLARVEQSGVELRRSNAELEQFAYVASHDLQEPLRKVAGFCELLERRYGDQLDDRAHQYIEFAVDGAMRMQRLILDLLAFSRVGRTTEGFEAVDLGAALVAALANLEARITESGAEITQDELPTVQGDASLLTAMFQNLIGNAIKFRSEAAPHIEVGCERDGEDWAITVADNGIGIEPEYAERVFVIFQRLHAKDQYEGTGIGLSMCKKIVEFHGGRIAVSPREGGGTLARFTLPVNASAEAHV
ncbi:MAG: multi-sensor signal transduction histidine kinase, partial [Solirubrobacteraceae bacterium]|nr:multi-sensor signal transduction histidine kinase [Solirubrobacteraceae bacterium]